METASVGISEFTVPDSEKPKNKETCDSCDFSCDTEEDLTCHRESSNLEKCCPQASSGRQPGHGWELFLPSYSNRFESG